MIGRRRKKTDDAQEATPDLVGGADEFSDVTLVKMPAKPDDDTDEADAAGASLAPGNEVLAELSRAFGEEPPPAHVPPRDDSDASAPAIVTAEDLGVDPSSPGAGADPDATQGANSPTVAQRAAASTDAVATTVISGEIDDEDGTPSSGKKSVITFDADNDTGSAVYLDDLVDDADLDMAASTRSSRRSGMPTGRPATTGTVIIDDDATGDAVHADGRAADGTMEPRLRSRRIGVKRAAGRRRLRIAGLIGAGVVGVIAVLAILGSSLFAVRDVDVSGAVYTDSEALAAIVTDIEGSPVLLVDTDEAEKRLEQIPWVESARVRTDFPNAVLIEIREREPVLTMAGSDGRFRVLDRDARVLEVIDGRPIAPVWITGPGALDLDEGDFAPVGYVAAAELVSRLTPEIRSRLETMLVNPGGSDLRMILTNEPWPPVEIRFGSVIGGEQQVEKLVLLQRQLDEPAVAPVERIDVSTNPVTQVGGVPVRVGEPES